MIPAYVCPQCKSVLARVNQAGKLATSRIEDPDIEGKTVTLYKLHCVSCRKDYFMGFGKPTAEVLAKMKEGKEAK